jgi:hypothetical protein
VLLQCSTCFDTPAINISGCAFRIHMHSLQRCNHPRWGPDPRIAVHLRLDKLQQELDEDRDELLSSRGC